MNRLIKALIERSQVIDQLVIDKTARRKTVTFGMLVDALGDTLFSELELGYLQIAPQVLQHLEQSYLPTITDLEWDRALSLTENRTTPNSGWWTAMVAGVSGHFGLTVPQTSSRREVIALYVGPEDNAKVLVYSLKSGAVREVTDGPHCGPSSNGQCLKGICGTCKPRQVYYKGASGGIKCVCDHQVGQQ